MGTQFTSEDEVSRGEESLESCEGQVGGVERGARPRAPPRRQRLWAPGASPQGAGRRWGLGPSPRPAASRTSPHFSPASGPVAPQARPLPAWDGALSSRRLPRARSDAWCTTRLPLGAGLSAHPPSGERPSGFCLFSRALARLPRGKDTPQPCAEGRGRRAPASSQLTLPACERTPSSPSQASGRDAAQPPRARHGFVRGPETEPSSKDPRSGPAEVVCDS